MPKTVKRELTPFARNLARYRRLAKMTQDELADEAELTRPTISELESGRAISPDWKTITALSRALRVGRHDLFRDDTESPVEKEFAAFLASEEGQNAAPGADEIQRLRQESAGIWIGLSPTPLSFYHFCLGLRAARPLPPKKSRGSAIACVKLSCAYHSG